MSVQTEAAVRLSSEFGSLIPAAVINEVVTQCDHDLSGTPNTARPEMLERLARQRLAFLDRPVAWIN